LGFWDGKVVDFGCNGFGLCFMLDCKISEHNYLLEEEKTIGIVSSILFYHLVIVKSSAGDSIKSVSEKDLSMPSGKKIPVILFNCLILT
jgi:hypothetical protein